MVPTNSANEDLAFYVCGMNCLCINEYRAGAGGNLLNLLKAPAGVYLVSLEVFVDGKASKHGVMLSRLAEVRAPHGKLIDNHGKMEPCYLEARDTFGKEAAEGLHRPINPRPRRGGPVLGRPPRVAGIFVSSS